MGEKKPDGGHGGFAFLTLDSCEVVDRICANKFHHVGPHLVDVKKAHPKDADLKLLSEQNNVEKNNNNPKGTSWILIIRYFFLKIQSIDLKTICDFRKKRSRPSCLSPVSCIRSVPRWVSLLPSDGRHSLCALPLLRPPSSYGGPPSKSKFWRDSRRVLLWHLVPYQRKGCWR